MTPDPVTGTTAAVRHRPLWIDAARAVVELAALLAIVAVALRALDQLPGMAAGVARGVRRIDSLAALETQIAHRMPIPSYFPDTLAWPPRDLLTFGGTSASMSIQRRQSGDTWLIVAMASGAPSVAPQVLPPATPLQYEATVVRRLPATVERLRDLDGVIWYQLTWRTSGATRVVRYRGTLDETMLIANSIDERGR
jgi:hypothetical protein